MKHFTFRLSRTLAVTATAGIVLGSALAYGKDPTEDDSGQRQRNSNKHFLALCSASGGILHPQSNRDLKLLASQKMIAGKQTDQPISHSHHPYFKTSFKMTITYFFFKL